MARIGKVGKQRSRSVAKKRVKRTGSGKAVINKVAHNHLLLQKSKKQKGKAKHNIVLSKGEVKKIDKMLV